MTNRFLEWSESLGRTPVVPLLGHPGALLTNTTLKANLTDADTQTKSLKALEKAVSPDALFCFMDLTVEAEGLGAGIAFPEDVPPSVRVHPVSDEEQLSLMDVKADLIGRMEVFVDTVKKAKEVLDVPLCVYTIGPFTLASQMMGVEKTCVNCAVKPAFVSKLVEKSTEVVIRYASALVDAGADVYCMLEPSASLISCRHFKKFSGPFCKEVFDATSKAWSVLHICGKTRHLLKGMVATGAEGLSLDADVDFLALAEECPEDIVLIGNTNPVLTVMQKSPAEIREAVFGLRHEMKGHRNFILSTGCDLPLGTPLENVKAFVEAGKRVI